MLEFSRIVALRQRRFDRMLKIESMENAALSEAQLSLSAAQHAIDSYLEETRTLELDLLTRLLNKRVSVNDLLAVEEELKLVKEKARALAERRAECQARLLECKERARIARRNRASSALKLNKSSHIQGRLLELRMLAAEATEEAVADEFSEQRAHQERGQDDA